MPAKPAATGIQNCAEGSIPPRVATAAITSPAASPAMLPGIVMPPSVPAGTRCQVVIMRALARLYCPISLATVSVAASARADAAAMSQTRLPVALKAMAARAATARLARTCHAVRPSRGSATPSACLRRYPSRVETQVITNSAASMPKAAGPMPAKSRKQASPPAGAPERLTPRRARASSAKPSVTPAAIASRCGDEAQAWVRKGVSIGAG